MGSEGRRAVGLSDLALPPKNEAQDHDAGLKKPPSLNVVGSVKEKGFSTDPIPLDRISFPQPRVTPFPVARHRSDGPHWGPPSSRLSSFPATPLNGDEGGEMSAAVLAEPLQRKKNGQTSRWRTGRKSDLQLSLQTQNVFDDSRQHVESQEISTTAIDKHDHGDHQGRFPKVVAVATGANNPSGISGYGRQSANEALQRNSRPDELGKVARQSEATLGVEIPQAQGRGLEHAQSGRNFTDQDIDTENRNSLFAMSSEEVAEAQAELTEKMRPEFLELLRKRGAAKERKRLAEKAAAGAVSKLSNGDNGAGGISGKKMELIEAETSAPLDLHHAKSNIVPEDGRFVSAIQRDLQSVTIPSDHPALKQRETVRGTKVGPADLLTAPAHMEVPSNGNTEESTPPLQTEDPWTLRVEAVRSMRFDLDGSVISVGPGPLNDKASESNSAAAGVAANSQRDIFSVAERDYLRTEGDPGGAGYLLKEALALVRSTVPGQRAVALHLIASVLNKAIHGLQNQKFDPCTASHHEGIGGPVDWQAIWAYALGPEAELVLTLRLALDDGHSTVVAACARAIQALFSYSTNETYFDFLEALWPGDKVVFTAPIFRRKTKQNEGFIGGGRWKYNVKTSEIFPFSGTAEQERTDEDGKDTVADDIHVSNKDVAAGLIRMGLLPRIRYLIEVDKLIAAEEALLSVLISMARHSPMAANAVMKCPRLIDAILQRFIGTDTQVSEESWSSRLKAIRLLKVLSQAKRSNCVYFVDFKEALQTLIRPLLLQAYVNQSPSHERDLGKGYNEIMIESVRFWRVCIDYGVGISLFSEVYPTLCFWLLPLSKDEIIRTGKDETLVLAIESYLLLEHIARTLPLLHTTVRPMAVAGQVDPGNWSWGVAQAMVDTAMKWVSPECISGVHVLVEQLLSGCERSSQETVVLKSSTRKVLGTVATVLHFLATVCEKVVSETELNGALDDPKNFSLPWLPTFLPELGLVLARSGLLNYSQVGLQSHSPGCALQLDMPVPTLITKHTFLDYLHFCQAQADHDSTLVAINCLIGLVRVSSVVDKLIHVSKPKAIPSQVNQSVGHKILKHGLLACAEVELRNLLVLCKENVIAKNDLMQMNVRGGPAPGLGIGWGSSCGGAWSKEVLIAQGSARLALNLISVFSSNFWPSHFQSEGETVTQEGQLSEELLWTPSGRVKFGLAVVATSTNMNRELVHQVCSSILFHPSTLLVLIQKIEEVLVSWRSKGVQEADFQGESHTSEDKILDPEFLSKVLLQHFGTFWLAVKKREGNQKVGQVEFSKRKSDCSRPNLATVDEEPSDNSISPPESLMQEWVGQRLPLPSHWFLSPMVVDLTQATGKEWDSQVDSISEQTAYLEEVIKAGLTFFLGYEANVSEADLFNVDIPLVRKIHSLSAVFVSGGDVFLHSQVRALIGALQDLIGVQIGKQSRNLHQHRSEGRTVSEDVQRELQNGSDEPGVQVVSGTQDEATSGDLKDSESIMEVNNPSLNFEVSIDASYLSYAEAIAEHFVNSSYGDIVFARQVAFHLSLEVPDMIRLATWRVLTDGRVLELLPPLSQCCGPLQKYLDPIVTNQQILESFASTWSSGALDKAAKRNSLSFTLVLHHLGGHLFDTVDTEDTLLLKKKMIRTLVRSTVRNLGRQEMLSRLVCYVPAWPCSDSAMTKEAERAFKSQIKLRLLLLSKACEGDASLTMEVERLQKFIVGRR